MGTTILFEILTLPGTLFGLLFKRFADYRIKLNRKSSRKELSISLILDETMLILTLKFIIMQMLGIMLLLVSSSNNSWVRSGDSLATQITAWLGFSLLYKSFPDQRWKRLLVQLIKDRKEDVKRRHFIFMRLIQLSYYFVYWRGSLLYLITMFFLMRFL